MSSIHPSLHQMTRVWAISFFLTWLVGLTLLILAPFLRPLMPLGWPTWPISLTGGYIMIVSPIIFIVMVRRYRRASWVLAHVVPKSRTVIAIEKTRTGRGWAYQVRLAEGEQTREIMCLLIPPRNPGVAVGQTVWLYFDPEPSRMAALQTSAEQIAWLHPLRF